jgi:hypothetical protein
MQRTVRALRLISVMIIALVVVAGVVGWIQRPSVRSVERAIAKENPTWIIVGEDRIISCRPTNRALGPHH